MRPWQLVLTLGLLTNSPLQAANRLCLGAPPEKAKVSLVYLHGLDSPVASAQELKARQDLDRMGKAQDIAVTVVRSKWQCPKNNGELCWPYATASELQTTLDFVEAESRSCKTKDLPQVLFGFSNGGYFAGRLLTACKKTSFRLLLTSGSAGTLPPRFSEKSLAHCGEIALLMGTGDTLTRSKAQRFHAVLSDLKARVTYAEFAGGHVVAADAVLAALKGAGLVESPSFSPPVPSVKEPRAKKP